MIRAHVGEGDVTAALGTRLAQDYAGRGIALVRRGDRWQFETAPDLARLLRRDREEQRKLSRAGTETLAIIALSRTRQPCGDRGDPRACRYRRERWTC